MRSACSCSLLGVLPLRTLLLGQPSRLKYLWRGFGVAVQRLSFKRFRCWVAAVELTMEAACQAGICHFWHVSLSVPTSQPPTSAFWACRRQLCFGARRKTAPSSQPHPHCLQAGQHVQRIGWCAC